MPTVVSKLFAGQGTRRTDGRTDVPTLHIVSYFAGTDAFMSLHKTPKKHFKSLPTVFIQNISP